MMPSALESDALNHFFDKKSAAYIRCECMWRFSFVNLSPESQRPTMVPMS